MGREVEEEVEACRRLLRPVAGRNQHARRTAAREDERLAAAKVRYAECLKAQEVVQSAAQQVQHQVHSRMATVVSRCLRAVFDDPYQFKIVFERKRGKTDARLVFVEDGHEVSPSDAAFGGALDVGAFALRLACLLMTRPARRRLLVLDEPFRCVDAAALPRVRALLERLAEEMKVQFVVVTHSPALRAGQVVEL